MADITETEVKQVCKTVQEHCMTPERACDLHNVSFEEFQQEAMGGSPDNPKAAEQFKEARGEAVRELIDTIRDVEDHAAFRANEAVLATLAPEYGDEGEDSRNIIVEVEQVPAAAAPELDLEENIEGE